MILFHEIRLGKNQFYIVIWICLNIFEFREVQSKTII